MLWSRGSLYEAQTVKSETSWGAMQYMQDYDIYFSHVTRQKIARL